MSNQIEVKNNQKWSLFSAFCCGNKGNKKSKAAVSNNQSSKNILQAQQSPQTLNQYSSIQNQNNQTNAQMRPRSFNQEDDDEVSSYSSNNHNQFQNRASYQPQLQQQLQSQREYHQTTQQQQQQQQYNHYQYQQNNVINIQSNPHQRNYENVYPQSNISNQLVPPPHHLGSVSSRRAFSVNYNNNMNQSSSYNGNGYSHNNSNVQFINNNNQNNQQYLQQQIIYHPEDQRCDTQNSQASNISQNQSRYYTMANQFFKLKTKFAIHEVDFVESRPTEKAFQSYFNFDCPICFRHFNRILKSNCCDHYLCHYCLRDIYNKAKESPSFDYRCMFCQVQSPQYIDVNDTEDKVKRYSDSPFVTPKDGIVERVVKPFTVGQNFDHNIHNNLIEFQDDSMDKENIDFKQNEINIINNCSTTHNINKPPLPHLVLNQNMSIPPLQQINNPHIRKEQPAQKMREKNGSMVENENVNQSAHKPAGTIPEFQNKYHCNYLQHSSNQRVQTNLQSQLKNESSQNTNIKSIR